VHYASQNTFAEIFRAPLKNDRPFDEIENTGHVGIVFTISTFDFLNN